MKARNDQPAHRAAHARPFAVLLAVLAVLLTACGPSGGAASGDEGGGLSIVATTTILGDVTAEVAGDAAEVSVLMEAGADPHSFEASAQQMALMQEADLIVANGANLEEHILDPLAEAERAGVPMFHAIDHVEPLTFDGAHDDPHAEEDDHATDTEDDDHATDTEDDDHATDTEDDDHDHDGIDPHFWTDPTRMAAVAHALGEQIGELAADADAVAQRADEYAGRLEQLDHEIEETLSSIPADARTLVTNHEAFNYFAARYGFTVVGTVIPGLTTGAEASAQDIEELHDVIEREQVQAVFAENTAPERLAGTLAQDAGTEVHVVELYSDSLGPPDSDAATYVDLLRTNARLVSDALGR